MKYMYTFTISDPHPTTTTCSPLFCIFVTLWSLHCLCCPGALFTCMAVLFFLFGLAISEFDRNFGWHGAAPLSRNGWWGFRRPWISQIRPGNLVYPLSFSLCVCVCMCGVCGVIRSGCPERLLCTPSAWILQLLPWSGSDRLFLTGSPCLPLWENTQVLAPLLHFSCLMPVYASWVVWDIYGSVLHCGGLFENHNFSFIFMCCGKSQLKSILLL